MYMQKHYKYLVWAGTTVLVVLTLFLMVSIDHISNTATTTNTVSFDGEGRIFAKPDIAAISFSIVTEATTSKKAQDDNSKKSQKIVDFVKEQGIDDKDIKTTGYNVYPQYSYPRPCPPGAEYLGAPDYPCQGQTDQQKISGYQVNQSFEVKIRDLEKISTILDGLITAGANQVNNLGFKIDNEEGLKEEARAKAIENAKSKADKLKKQLGIRLGKIINYNEGGYYPTYFKTEFLSADGRGGGVSGPSVPAGENEIVVNVTITYQIK